MANVKNNGEALKVFNEKYSADFMFNYCKDNGKAEWWNTTISSTKVDKKGGTRRITLAEVRSAFVREFFPQELKGAKKADWRKLI